MIFNDNYIIIIGGLVWAGVGILAILIRTPRTTNVKEDESVVFKKSRKSSILHLGAHASSGRVSFLQFFLFVVSLGLGHWQEASNSKSIIFCGTSNGA